MGPTPAVRVGITKAGLLAVTVLAFVSGYFASSSSSLRTFQAAPILSQLSASMSGCKLGGNRSEPNPSSSPKHCAQVFTEYVPSSWEQGWAVNAKNMRENPHMVCKQLLSEFDNSQAWVHSIQKGHLPSQREVDRRIFSEFRYRNNCTGEEYPVLIEPLVGHFRHPFVPSQCRPNITGLVNPDSFRGYVLNRTYILLVGHDLQRFKSSVYPGKKYLFDVGHNFYMSQTGWLIEHYAEMGIVFDEIWAWEPKRMDNYWSTVPRYVQPRLHYYNMKVALNASDPSNPLNIVRRIAKPGDYVVFKLDIDDASVEMVLFKQIINSPDLQPLLSELLFEMHYDHPNMRRYFGGRNGQDWLDVFDTFTAVRRSGIRLHYWP